MTTTKPAAKPVIPSKDSLDAYASGKYGAELVLAKAKIGKTMTLLANCLGAYPWQQNGGIVDDPANLHIITFDAVTLDGSKDFLINRCGASKEVGRVHVQNLEGAAAAAFRSKTDYDSTFPSKVYEAVEKVKDRVGRGGVHVLLICSFTIMAKAWLRSISGPAFVPGGAMRKSPMDQNKWGLFAQQMAQFQFEVQDVDKHHTIWEAHWAERESKKKDSQGDAKVFDSIQVQGQTAEQFPTNIARPYMLNRKKGGYKPGSLVDLVEFDTQPNLDFGDSMTAGRKVVGVLEPKEQDLTVMFHKLGLTIGGWGT